MAESKAEHVLDRFCQWVGRWLFRPVGRVVLTAFLGLCLVGCVWLDDNARARGVRSLFAPTREDLSLSFQLGAALGVVAFLADFLHSLARRVTRLFRVSRAHEQPQRKRLWVTVGAIWSNGWSILCLIPIFAAGLWFTYHGCLPLVPWIAPLAVIIPGTLVIELIFGPITPEEQPQATPAEN